MPIIPLLLACVAIDGDTLRCGAERVRLIGIDAPELPGHCRRGRHCAPGDSYASRASLAAALKRGKARIERDGTDHYGRTLALVWAGRVNLACWQLRTGHAIYRRDWDEGGKIKARCRA